MKKRYIVAGVSLTISLLIVFGPRFLTHTSQTSTFQSPTNIPYKMVQNSAKYSYPQITDYPNSAVMKKVNDALSEEFSTFGCDKSTPDESNEWNVVVSVDYAKNDIFSVNQSGNYYCGGAYPTNDYSRTLTFNMTTGEQIPFDSLFTDYPRDQDIIITTIYGDIIDQTNVFIKKNPKTTDTCDSINTFESLKTDQDYRISSSSKSIIVRPDYPHVIESCIPTKTIPIEKLLPFSSKDSILKRI